MEGTSYDPASHRFAATMLIPPYSRSAALMLYRAGSGDKRAASGGAKRFLGGRGVR
jgi:hypothetical protein